MKRNIAIILLLHIIMNMVYGLKSDSDTILEKRIDEIISEMTMEEKIAMIGGYEHFNIRPLDRLGIPKIKMADGPVGIRNYGKSTAYPASICLTASWDIHLAQKVGQSIAREAKAKNVHIVLGPAMNIHRGPWCGRNFEYMGEDPFLAGEMATYYIQGIQGEGVMATAKHYVANYQDYNRHHVSSDMDERTLREIYLPAFKASVMKGDAAAIMTAYNLVNGIHCSEHSILINDILKDEWGFDGIVMSDWTSTYSVVDAANAGLDLEMPFGKYMNADSLLPVIEKGLIPVAVIDDKVRRMLRMMFRFGYFDQPDIARDIVLDPEVCNEVALEAARGGIVLLKNEDILPLDRTTKKTILLLGPNVFNAITGGGGSSKVDPMETVSVYEGLKHVAGENIEILYTPGPFFRIPEKFYKESNPFYTAAHGEKMTGLKLEVFDNMNLEGDPAIVDMDTCIDYETEDFEKRGISKERISMRWSGYLTVDKTADYRFVVSGDDGYRLYIDGEKVMDEWKNQPERTNQKNIRLIAGREYSVKLEYYQDRGGAVIRFGYKEFTNNLESEALEMAAKADIVIAGLGFNDNLEGEGSDRDFKLPEIQEKFLLDVIDKNKNTIVVLNSGGNVDMSSWLPGVKALLHAWYSGQAGGLAIAEIIFGDINPSGKLPVSFEKRWEDNPTYNSYHDDDGDLKVYFDEGVFLGYRYYDSKNVEPLFPFGYGLSYTTFEYSNLQLGKKAINANEILEIKVDIKNTGDKAGSEVVQLYISDDKASVSRPHKELKAFDKVNLQPGEKRTVTMKIDKSALSFFSMEKKEWTAEPGMFSVLVGSSSRDIRLTDTFELK